MVIKIILNYAEGKNYRYNKDELKTLGNLI